MSLPTPMYEVALAGFEQARARLVEQIRVNPNVREVLIPAMEAAYWANALDLKLRDDDLSYRGLNGPGPELMLGLRYVRNRAAHQLPMVVRTAGGFSFPVTFPAAFGPITVHWRPLAELPPADANHQSPRGEAAYVARFENRIVPETLEEVAQWFAGERSRRGSFLNR
ncbi:hypothetical protein [Streptomyces sp. NPDC088733]|uniref:hypothetical protein n=1 Tax=Streptomyces sp. NPDC088733 TaxID=3365880 RepID=UPI0037FB9ACC